MASIFVSLLGTPTFKFLIGEDKTPFFVHVSVLAKASKVLNVLAQGSMAEAIEGVAVLEDCPPHVFARFCEFTYMGDYEAAKALVASEASMEGVTATGAGAGGAAAGQMGQNALGGATAGPATVAGTTTAQGAIASSATTTTNSHTPTLPRFPRTTKKRASATNPWNIFLKEDYGSASIFFDPPTNDKPSTDFTPVFLSHVELYIFADRYDVPDLRDLCLYKLHQTLIHFIIFPERVGDISRMVEYVYNETPEKEGESDRLRELVAHYASVSLEDLMVDREFEEEILLIPGFAKDILRTNMKTMQKLEYRIAKA
ncbi:hypothetical protein FQN54_002813 [Arachnomyces sp. PD_36]|nr:hypothetical protein FQN54_002813 [Arachnomyces sp. PD_36]